MEVIEPIPRLAADATALLSSITLQICFDPKRWPDFVVIAQIVPDGDVVPVRADYRAEDWSIGVNPLHSEQPLWYTLPDLIASVLLTGRVPTIVRALRFVPVGANPTCNRCGYGATWTLTPRMRTSSGWWSKHANTPSVMRTLSWLDF